MIPRRSPRRARGVTLVELLVALAVGAVVLAALFGVVQSQQAAYYEGHLQRAAQNAARTALTFLEQRLAVAGYGMDAPLAFDFTRYGLTADYPAPCPPLAAGCPRDAVDGNDELVFHSRNPRYWLPEIRTDEPRGNAWRITSLFGDVLRVNARQGDRFVKGRILQLVCKDGLRYAYVTVAASAPAAAPLPADGALDVALVPALATDPFRRQDIAQPAAEACFTNGEARAFLIDRYRIHVRPVQTAAGMTPYLVLDTGLDPDGDGPEESEETILAEGIESFQVGYLLANGALAPRGTAAGVQIAFAPGMPGVTAGAGLTTLDFPGGGAPGDFAYAATSWYRYSLTTNPLPAERLTDHQANIRAVRIALVARGPQPEPGLPRPAEVLTPILNQSALPAWVQTNQPYNRARVETTVLVRNMTARALNEF